MASRLHRPDHVGSDGSRKGSQGCGLNESRGLGIQDGPLVDPEVMGGGGGEGGEGADLGTFPCSVEPRALPPAQPTAGWWRSPRC